MPYGSVRLGSLDFKSLGSIRFGSVRVFGFQILRFGSVRFCASIICTGRFGLETSVRLSYGSVGSRSAGLRFMYGRLIRNRRENHGTPAVGGRVCEPYQKPYEVDTRTRTKKICPKVNISFLPSIFLRFLHLL